MVCEIIIVHGKIKFILYFVIINITFYSIAFNLTYIINSIYRHTVAFSREWGDGCIISTLSLFIYLLISHLHEYNFVGLKYNDGQGFVKKNK